MGHCHNLSHFCRLPYELSVRGGKILLHCVDGEGSVKMIGVWIIAVHVLHSLAVAHKSSKFVFYHLNEKLS